MILVDTFAFFVCAVLILMLPLDWLLSGLCAAALHEVGHIIAIYASGGNVLQIRIGVHGAEIRTDLRTTSQELCCAAAGPAVSLLLLLFCRTAPKLALCALIQGVFNLMPVYPLDGGRMLQCLLSWLWPKSAEWIGSVIGMIWCTLLLFLSVTAAIRKHISLFQFLVICGVLFRLLRGNIPCKSGKIAIQ
ncbi:MAG: hypothetical protein SOW84_05680 [Candidatus Faecousia sp.]|nr:hypothetical protein [Candidatus Faecousia sp.]